MEWNGAVFRVKYGRNGGKEGNLGVLVRCSEIPVAESVQLTGTSSHPCKFMEIPV